ncbi:hypothetical protein PHLCEN_2v2218 [Hermanssonia centrifuga]|uniref:Uncharacterized protein n=1 Tax=Hermanssonia centrifuga TaxID=98765 RepID=A0A2R6RPM7_9APHY|nr:hypothetical protein PHLCEN_2v2218 [Hermanssonia centrifuga]
MSVNIHGARERIITGNRAIVECTHATWTFNFINGYVVTLHGPLTAHIAAVLPNHLPLDQRGPPDQPWAWRFEKLQFDAIRHEKYLSIAVIRSLRISNSPATPHLHSQQLMNGTGMAQQEEEDRRYDDMHYIIDMARLPMEPVNAFGIPQATMRCLELAESVSQMTDLITYANAKGMGPRDSLRAFAAELRKNQGGGMPNASGSGQHGPGAPGGGPGLNGLHAMASSSALYGGAQPNAPAQPPSSLPPQNGPLTGTPKQSKAVPPSQPQASGSGSTAPVSASTPTSTTAGMTPALPPSTLKRKATTQSDTASPTTGNSEQGSGKRPARKRRTQGG